MVLRALLFICLMVIVGCQTTSYEREAPVGDIWIDQGERKDVDRPPETTEPSPKPKPSSPQPAPEPPSSPDVAYDPSMEFYQQGLAAYESNDFWQAINLAERGLRINHRRPELYWLLAASYFELGDYANAYKFSDIGLKYAKSGTKVRSDLVDVKNKSAKKLN